MTTPYTHGFLGLGMGAVYARRRMPVLFWGLALLLPICPDFDAVSTAGYGTILGHRGFTHSLAFALALGLIVAALSFKYLKVKFWTLALFFFLVTASHGLLDALTKGGFGIPFFWPISSERYGNWGPIKVADIGFELPDPRKSRSVRDELWWVWLPTFIVVTGVIIWRWLRRRTALDISTGQDIST